METRYFWTVDQVGEGNLRVLWYPGAENLGDYVTKHHPASHHLKVRPLYQHQQNSPRTLRRALAPSVMRGCVDSVARPRARTRSDHATWLLQALLAHQSHNLVRT